MDILVYALVTFLCWSVLLFVKAVMFDRRTKQWPGLLMAAAAIPLFALYYNDRPPFQQYALRRILEPLAVALTGDAHFVSNVTPAALVGCLYLVRIVVFFRLAVKLRRTTFDEDLLKVNDRVGNFFTYTTVAIMLAGTTVSIFSLGWVGSLSIGLGFALLYMGIIGILADTVTLAAVSSTLGSLWLWRRMLALVTAITRLAIWVANLYRAIRPNLRKFISAVREAIGRQRDALSHDVEVGNEQLVKTGHDRDDPRPDSATPAHRE